MFSWRPSVSSLPATIQRRFLSFILKRSLGHLVKPGQLDPAQIDTQIGSGFVQVNDIELDHNAINEHLADLPLPFRLEAGSIGRVSARIPWSNLLTAPFALSLSSLSLTFVVVTQTKEETHISHVTDDLAETVASVAESFIHNELSEKENQVLQESLNLDPQPRTSQSPGYIDPFLSTEDLDAGQQVEEDDCGEDDVNDADPSTQGVSLLATLIERVLARFEFDASDITLRVVLPRKAEFVLRLGQVAYSTEAISDPDALLAERGPNDGEIRTVKVATVSLSTRDLSPPPSQSSSTSRQRSASPFDSSSSEEDEEAMMMMSHSLVSLPPPSMHSISPSSTMYHSATSSLRSLSPEPPLAREERETSEEKIMSLGLGSEPLVFTLITPPLVVPEAHAGTTQCLSATRPRFQPNPTNQIRLTVSLGPVAIALNPVHARSLQYLSSALATSHPSNSPAKLPPHPPANSFIVSLHVKSITLLLTQLTSPFLPSHLVTADPLLHFFVNRPGLTPSPRIPHLRIQLDALDVSHSSLPAATTAASRRTNAFGPPAASESVGSRQLKASLADLSVFAFSAHSHGNDESWTASPVLVSDPNLGTQYERDAMFPEFDVVDWTRSGVAGAAGKVSQWRVRPSHTKRRSTGTVPSATAGSPRASHVPVFQVQLKSGGTGQIAVCEADVIPLHLFVDVSMVDGAANFVGAATVAKAYHGKGEGHNYALELEDTPPATPRARGHPAWEGDARERERRRLETLVMDDFIASDADPSASSLSGTNFVLSIPLFRVQMRAPSPPGWTAGPRSGALVLDLHGVRVTQQDEELASTRRKTRFQSRSSKAVPRVLGNVEFRRLLAAGTPPGESKATTFLSVAVKASTTETPPSAFGVSPLMQAHSSSEAPLPSLCLRSNPVLPHRPSTTTSPGAASSFSLDSYLPSVCATLSKSALDSLTFWADDVTQSLLGDNERAASSDASGRSRDPSLIGSRFFAKRTASTGSSESGGEGRKSEVVVKVSVSKVQITLLVPRKGSAGKARPLNVNASDVDFLAEIKPEGKDETVVTVGVMDLDVNDTSASGDIIVILGLTIPRNLTTSPKSLLKLRFISVVDSDTSAKESRLKVTVSGFTYFFTPDFDWVADAGLFAKTPEGAFESVIPSERTKVAIKVTDGSLHVTAPKYPSALVAYIGELDFSTDLVGDSPETVINIIVLSSSVFFLDNVNTSLLLKGNHPIVHTGAESWKQAGYALLAEISDLGVRLCHQINPSVNTQVYIENLQLKLHACADSLPALGAFASDLGSVFQDIKDKPLPKRPTATSRTPQPQRKRDVLASVDEHAFRRVPDLGPAPDMIHDDLPTNLDYLDASFGTAAGLRELRDDDLFDFEPYEPDSGRNTPTFAPGVEGVIANVGGETIRMLNPHGIRVVEGHFENIPEEAVDFSSGSGDAKLSIRVRNCDVTLSLYDGYDWVRTRKVIEDEVKAIRRRLVKIRQLLASGQASDDSIEETSTILFNSVYIGLPQDPDELEPGALIAAIDAELNEEAETETASQSSWQSFNRRPQHGKPRASRGRGQKLSRSTKSRIDFCLTEVQVEVDQYHPNVPLVSRVLVTVRDLEILDHIKTSTWKKFLTELRTDFKGNVRETASNMVRAELRIVHPVPDLPNEEGRFRAKVLPIKLHVDQDALDFMKKFFSFQDPEASLTPTSPENELYFQHVEVFPVDLKLDYKPKRVDYKALREGKTIELMNFFHFDGAEITLRHITLSGIAGWPRLFETLNDLWTPDVKANQLADIISGVSPIRSFVNVGSGVADLVLLPIAQYKKDKRVVRGVQKGTTSFVKSTAIEAIKLGARLATGTQVILEQAETVLGGQGQFKDTVTAETLQTPISTRAESSDEESENADLISKYADQPQDVREGMQSAYKSLSKNFNSAAQTILAVPMEVYERSGNEGPVRAVVRAVPIAVLKPMIGASEAVSKTLFGLRNAMDPEVKHENEAKYKQR